MNFKVYLNNSSEPLKYVVQGVPFQEELSDVLDACTIRYIDYENEEPLEPDMPVKVQIDESNIKYYLVANDYVEHPSKIVNVSIHNVNLIECTNYLSKIVMASQAFTLKEYRYRNSSGEIVSKPTTMLDYINFALINAETLSGNENPRFYLDDKTKALFENIPSEDFFFDKPKLKDVLSQMFAVKSVRPYVKKIDSFDKIVISHMNLNPIGKHITLDVNLVAKNASSDTSYHSTHVDTSFENAVDRKVIASHGWDKLRPLQGGVVTTESYGFSNLLPIESVTKFLIKANVSGSYTYEGDKGWESYTAEGYAALDITSRIIDSELYELLSAQEQKKYIPYTRGTNQFGGLHYKTWLGFEKNKLMVIAEEMVNKVLWEEIDLKVTWNDPYTLKEMKWSELSEEIRINISSESDIYVQDIDEYEYYIEYIPYITSRVSLSEKNNLSRKTSQIANPEEKNISLSRYGKQIKNKVEQLGNSVKVRDCFITDISELKELGDYTDDNYVISSREYAISEKFIKVHYQLTQNFSNSLLKSSISREKRLYSIPLESITSHLLFKEYIVLSTEQSEHTGTFMKTPGINMLLNRQVVKRLAVKTSAMQSNGRSYFVIDTIPFVFGNSIAWHFEMLDNYSIDLGVAERVIGGKAVAYNPYIDTVDGTIITINTNAMIQSNATHDIDNYHKYSKLNLVPIVIPINGEQINSTVIENQIGGETDACSVSIPMYKDPYIKIAGTIQEKFISDNEELIVVGDSIGLIGITKDQLYLYISEEKYNIRDKYVKSNSVKYELQINVVDNKLEVTLPEGEYSSWAIGTNNGDLLFAVNDKTSGIYFTNRI